VATIDELPTKTRKATDRMLGPDEDVITVVLGRSKQALVITDTRILVIKPGIMAGAGRGAKASSYPHDHLASINVYTGPGVAAIELVPIGEEPSRETDLRAAYQLSNWLPCDKATAASPQIAELRTFVQSGGRSRSARAALADS
jgi:hypothetical protein